MSATVRASQAFASRLVRKGRGAERRTPSGAVYLTCQRPEGSLRMDPVAARLMVCWAPFPVTVMCPVYLPFGSSGFQSLPVHFPWSHGVSPGQEVVPDSVSNPVSPTEPPGDRGSFLALRPPKTALGSQAVHSGSSMEPNGGNRARRIPFDGLCLSILAAGTNTTWIFYCGFLPLSLLSQAFSPSCVVRCSGVLC